MCYKKLKTSIYQKGKVKLITQKKKKNLRYIKQKSKLFVLLFVLVKGNKSV